MMTSSCLDQAVAFFRTNHSPIIGMSYLLARLYELNVGFCKDSAV
jgi:hypothetical protein